MTIVKQSELCFSAVHARKVRLHVPSASFPASCRLATSPGGERAAATRRISKLSVAAVTQVRPSTVAGHQVEPMCGKRCPHNNKPTATYILVARPV